MDRYIPNRHINFSINYSTRMSLPAASSTASPLRNNQQEKNIKRDEYLLKILYSQVDQPLNLNSSCNNHNNRANCDDEESLQFQQTITSTSQCYSNVSDENMPPPEFISSTQRQTEGLAIVPLNENIRMNKNGNTTDSPCTTPSPSQIDNLAVKDNPYMARLQRDLNSPSASTRLRALRALRSPKEGPYCNFDVPYEEQDIITEEERQAKYLKPKTIQEVMKDVIVYVEVRNGEDNRSDGIKQVISELGAKVNDRLYKNTTHVIFKNGLLSTYNKAKSWNIPIVSILWIEMCKKQVRLVDPKLFTISDIDRYENPELYKKMRRQKSMQPNSENKIRIRKPKPSTSVNTDEVESPNVNISAPKDNLPEIYGNFLDKLMANTENTDECFSKNSELLKVIKTSNFANVKFQSPSAQSLVSANTIDKDALNETPTNSAQLIDAKNEQETDVKDNQSNRRVSRRLSCSKVINYSEITTDDMDITVEKPKTPLKQIKRRRTLFTPQAMFSTIVEDDKSESPNSKKPRNNMSTVAMNISPQPVGNSTLKNSSTSKKGDRRKTMHTPKVMDETNIGRNNATSTPLHSFLKRKETLIKPNGNNTPTTSTNAIYQSPITANKPNTSHLSNSLNQSSQKETLIRKNPSATNLRRTLLTPNRLVEINRKMQMETKTQLNMSPAECNTTSAAGQKSDLNQSAFSTYNNNRSMTNIFTPKSTSVKNGSILDEYNSAIIFNSTTKPMSAKRKSIYDISMEIIDQRLQNINRNARLNRSVSESDICDDDKMETLIQNDTILTMTKSTPHLIKSVQKSPLPKSFTINHKKSTSLIKSNTVTSVPLCPTSQNPTKRKLFDPTSLHFGSSFEAPTKINETKNNNTNSMKRNRTDDEGNFNQMSQCPVKKIRFETTTTTVTKSQSVKSTKMSRNLKTNRRSSMMDFQKSAQLSSSVKKKPIEVKTLTPKPLYLVCTNMHKEQKTIVKETVELLGTFEMESTISNKTTHLVSGEPSRTINMLRGIARGLWILQFDWIIDSKASNEWKLEDLYEMKLFSNAVSICRAERQAFGAKYRIDIFFNIGPLYVSKKCKCPALKELIILCGGQITEKKSKAHYIITEQLKENCDTKCISPNWILDSIQVAKLNNIQSYILESNPTINL